jgi:3',5'-cyclic AMP phosphodiesterase CpdA
MEQGTTHTYPGTGRSGVSRASSRQAGILAIADIHVEVPDNRDFIERLRPRVEEDWLIVVGDVGEYVADVEWALATLADRFRSVVWVPGNHELWTPPHDPVQLRGEARYQHLVAYCRQRGIFTPEDDYPAWRSGDQSVVIAPLFTLYDYSFAGTNKRAVLASARAAGVVCTDELLLSPHPYPSVEEWCRERVKVTRARLDALPPGTRTVLVNHFPLLADPTRILRHPEFAGWCGTRATADWHKRYSAITVVYGHLHIPRTTVYDGVPFEEVSLGYPREWRARRQPPSARQIL